MKKKSLEDLIKHYHEIHKNYEINYEKLIDEENDKVLDAVHDAALDIENSYHQELNTIVKQLDQLIINLKSFYPTYAKAYGYYDLNTDLIEYKIDLIKDIFIYLEELVDNS